ncbi:integrase domain-containing protein [Castellaniella sp.]|uniref:integrase domain-containing protein n=1 Tax=Castellaniella sp. TaxID=1955812 RepID=UPI002AFEB503|nr:integrase domain-containing protein [Castellaniella sp.]
MSRNYNAGTRDMGQAGRVFLAAAAGRRECSFATVDVVSDRWRLFVQYAKAQGVGRLERVTPELVCGYGQILAAHVRAGEMSPAYGQNLLSAVNSVMALVRPWPTISPTKHCGIPLRSTVRKKAPASLDQTVFEAVMLDLRSNDLDRQAAVAGLARSLGLRSKEASLLNARAALLQANGHGQIQVCDGTKGGRQRWVPVQHADQVDAIQAAVGAQADGRSLVPGWSSWAQWRHGGLRDGREILKQYGISGYHDLRAAYACTRYTELTGQPAPVCRQGSAGGVVDDQAARKILSRELGHDRVQVVSAYIGAR